MTRVDALGASDAEHYDEIEDEDFPPPGLLNHAALLIVEVNKSRFMVLVKNVPDASMEHFEPELRWVEIMPEKGGPPNKRLQRTRR